MDTCDTMSDSSDLRCSASLDSSDICIRSVQKAFKCHSWCIDCAGASLSINASVVLYIIMQSDILGLRTSQDRTL